MTPTHIPAGKPADDFEVVWSGKDDSLSNLVKH